ncbi:MAG: hypothetical protein ACRDG9_07590, partial [Actinomycetota bacterium]
MDVVLPALVTLDEPEKGTVVIKGTDTAEALLDEAKGFIKETSSLRDTGAQKLAAQRVHGDKKGPRLGALLALDTASARRSARLSEVKTAGQRACAMGCVAAIPSRTGRGRDRTGRDRDRRDRDRTGRD